MATWLIIATYGDEHATRVALPLIIAAGWRSSSMTLTDSGRILWGCRR
jgi:hypothetical protein